MELQGIVYCITNNINGKQYVGITGRSLEKRFAEHCKADSYIGKAIRKNGAENFTVQKIDDAITRDDLIQKEISWIQKLGTFKKGYNQTLGGDGVTIIPKLEIELTDEQSRFVRLVDAENQKEIDVTDDNKMAVMMIRNAIYLYLISELKSDKRQAAKMLLRLKDRFKREVFNLNLFSESEVRQHAMK
ncbi:GIY-YIG nuclease family protein [Exiguobacterium sp. s102]|uniref:GIY-YIG nuclease family protein n=1 Tax=Exiguobacterium sp. s102 TaxID=2751212 RepID=UPI001BE9A4E6|nr:GIY-YIG nuclease family protein [Exiguobacterium sp. s102]